MFNLFRSGPTLSADDIVAKVKAGDMILIDIRDPGEIRMTGKAKGALEIPLAGFQMKVDPRSPECLPDLKSGKPVALYCASGARSGMAARAMGQMGYPEVHNLGSLHDWARAGGELG